MPIALFALSLAAFSIGTTEFLIAGILPDLSADFGVSIPTAGLLVTGYAVAVAIGGPILAILTARLPRKPMLVALLAFFTLGQALCAVAPSYPLLMAARILVAAAHGLMFGIGSIAAANLVAPERRGTALSIFLGGVTVAMVVGMPGGTAIGNAIGWRAAFWGAAFLAAISTLLVAWLVPPAQSRHEEGTSVRAEIAALNHQQVYLTYLLIALIMVGALAFETYLVPLLVQITGVAQEWTPLYLVLLGAGAVVGIYAGGRAADWKLMPSLLAILGAQALISVFMLLAVRNPVSMAICIFLQGILAFAFNSPVQARILSAAHAAPNLASTLISTAFNVGIALGAWAGALWIDNGLGYGTLPVLGIIMSLAAAGVTAISWGLDGKVRQPAAV